MQMKLIPLSTTSKASVKNRGKHFAQVDDEDYDFLMQWKWHAFQNRDTYYAMRRDYTEKRPRKIRMHRFLMNPQNDEFVDHKDRNTLNNQRSNLRICTRSQNSANRRSRRNSSSKYLGVCFYKKKNRWVANIKHGSHKEYLGWFKSESEAALAYNKAAVRVHGEFANLNKIIIE